MIQITDSNEITIIGEVEPLVTQYALITKNLYEAFTSNGCGTSRRIMLMLLKSCTLGIDEALNSAEEENR